MKNDFKANQDADAARESGHQDSVASPTLIGCLIKPLKAKTNQFKAVASNQNSLSADARRARESASHTERAPTARTKPAPALAKSSSGL